MDINNPLKNMFAKVSQDPNVSVVTITPAMAELLLKSNTKNRPISRTRVRMYADAMKRNQWKVSGESIKTSINALTGEIRLLDGQHRLLACVESGLSFKTLAVSDLDESVFSVIDRGKTRGNHDILAIAGIKSGSHIAPAVKYFIILEAGLNPRNKDHIQLVTGEDILTYTRENFDHVQWACTFGRVVDVAIGGIRTAWVVFAGIVAKERGERETVELFLNAMVTGEQMTAGDPRLALRNWVIRNGDTKNGGITSANVATYIRAFNSWVEGQEIKVMRQWVTTSEWPKISTKPFSS